MGKVIVNLLKFIGFFVFSLVLAVFCSFKYVFTGFSLLGRIAILGTYIGIAATFIYAPTIFFIIIGLFVFAAAVFAINMVKNPSSDNCNNNESSNSNDYKRTNKTTRNPFFDGMTFEEAKKEYRNLMKRYHPDNKDGSLEMTQKIAEAYSNFCTSCGR